MKLLRLSFLLLLSSACAKNGDDDGLTFKDAGSDMDSGTPDSGPNLGFDVAALANEIATAQCRFVTRCRPEIYDANANNEQGCITDTTEALTADFQDLAQLIEAGRVAYSEAQKTQCLQALGAADCVIGLLDGSPCDLMFTGTQELNDPCFASAECASDLYCNRAQGLGFCGACAQRPAKGAACDPFTPCVPNATCVNLAQQGQPPNLVCIPTDAPENGTCFTRDTGFCQGTLECAGNQTTGFTCQRPGGSGAQCNPQTFDFPDCDIFMGYVCDGTMCADLGWTDLNGACDATNFCREGYCNAGTCSPLPGAGMSCQGIGACAQDAFCDGSNCRPTLASGQTCSFSGECSGDLLCLGAGVNRQGMCGAYEWQLCQ